KRIDGGISHVGYFDSAEAALEAVKNDRGYEAIWAGLNPLPSVPAGFELNLLQSSPNRSRKDWYRRRTALLIDCDPVRTNGQKRSNSTDDEQHASLAQAEEIRKFLCDWLRWPQPIVINQEFHNHARIYDAGRMRATYVGSRWDLADQSNVLLMSALQP